MPFVTFYGWFYLRCVDLPFYGSFRLRLFTGYVLRFRLPFTVTRCCYCGFDFTTHVYGFGLFTFELHTAPLRCGLHTPLLRLRTTDYFVGFYHGYARSACLIDYCVVLPRLPLYVCCSFVATRCVTVTVNAFYLWLFAFCVYVLVWLLRYRTLLPTVRLAVVHTTRLRLFVYGWILITVTFYVLLPTVTVRLITFGRSHQFDSAITVTLRVRCSRLPHVYVIRCVLRSF